MTRRIPVVDLFAGPGGLSEGFSEARRPGGEPIFQVGLSIEKDPIAHRTLTLRSIFRLLRDSNQLSSYYRYVRGEVDQETFLRHTHVSKALDHARREARCAELGKADASMVDEWIHAVRRKSRDWVLIGGPPCQAYSLAGRSRRANDASFIHDEKHFLYREYLRIIAKHEPSVFVMENVKGLLSASHGGKSMIVRILEDLARPRRGLRYELRSFVVSDCGLGLSPKDYVIEAENYGVPQKRHRVILLGVRDNSSPLHGHRMQHVPGRSVSDVLDSLPRIRSFISGANDSQEEWLSVLDGCAFQLRGWRHPLKEQVVAHIEGATRRARTVIDLGGRFKKFGDVSVHGDPRLDRWLVDDELGGILQHQSRGHMASDLQRYLFAASYASVVRQSPRLRDLPSRLMPEHRNATGDKAPFEDRFRVQMSGHPSTTIVSHISKDGHYYIHPDAAQCRSLSVREAARLQTFPDNYFFEGNQTQQYAQVGNAVPPFLARQLASVVASVLGSETTANAERGTPSTAATRLSNRVRESTT